METTKIADILKNALNLEEVYVQGQDAHYSVIVVSEELSKLRKLKQEQAIYAPLMDYFSSGEIHALSIKTFSPEKWKLEKMLHLVG